MTRSAEFEIIRDVVLNGNTKKILEGNDFSWKTLLKMGSQNRVLYYFVREVLGRCEGSFGDTVHRDLKHIEIII